MDFEKVAAKILKKLSKEEAIKNFVKNANPQVKAIFNNNKETLTKQFRAMIDDLLKDMLDAYELKFDSNGQRHEFVEHVMKRALKLNESLMPVISMKLFSEIGKKISLPDFDILVSKLARVYAHEFATIAVQCVKDFGLDDKYGSQFLPAGFEICYEHLNKIFKRAIGRLFLA